MVQEKHLKQRRGTTYFWRKIIKYKSIVIEKSTSLMKGIAFASTKGQIRRPQVEAARLNQNPKWSGLQAISIKR